MTMKRTRIFAAVLGVAALTATALAGAIWPAGPPVAAAADPVVLTLAGNGTSREYTMTELQALPAYEGWSGMVNSHGVITKPQPVKGVALDALLGEVGGMTPRQSCDVTAIDGYGMTYMYAEAIGGQVAVYDDTTGEQEEPAAPLSAVLVYEMNGAPLTVELGGPLRTAFCQAENVNQVVDGHLMVKYVNRIQLRGALPDWKVRMYGLKRKNGTRQTSTLDRASYQSCAAPGCHGRTWVTPTGHAWSGVNLSYIMGRVDGGRSHGDDALNMKLAMRGYRIKLVSATGAYRIITSKKMLRSKKIILANKRDGVDLAARYYPLRLIGPYLKSRQYIGRITKIYMLPPK
jgi:DMSO/TMAO reductase YedYZ molybdopterin-dependent catalytic subunit